MPLAPRRMLTKHLDSVYRHFGIPRLSLILLIRHGLHHRLRRRLACSSLWHTMAGCTHKHEMETWAPFVCKVGKVLEYMAGLDSSSSSSSSRGNSSPKTKNTALTSNYFSRVRRLALNPILNSAGSTQNFARGLCTVEGTLECWRCSGTKHEVHTSHIDPAASRTPRASPACGGSDYTSSWRPPLPLPSTLTLPRRHTTPTGYHSTLAPVSVSAPTNSLMPSYFPAYLTRFAREQPTRGAELGGEGENEGGEDTDPLLPALDAVLASFPALCAVHGWNAARRDADAVEADTEAGAKHQDPWRAELHARNLDELHEEWEQGSGMGGG
ncbi:hypothetical protein B0H14DRAFT_3742246 [Mycena olivaceomarginata]|nr:hypothetical protein B0H14DRAFT_3742246 [Mycena olivaceomarginata]